MDGRMRLVDGVVCASVSGYDFGMLKPSTLWFLAAGLFAISAMRQAHGRGLIALAVVFAILGAAMAKRGR
jgi:hypothetical protein